MNNYYEILREVYLKYGQELFENKSKLRAYLKAFLFEIEIKNEIITSVNNGIVAEIAKNVKSYDDIEMIKMCILVIVDNYKIEKNIAISIVCGFVYAIFGKCVDIKSEDIISCEELEKLQVEEASTENLEKVFTTSNFSLLNKISCSDNITVGLKADGTVVVAGGENHAIAKKGVAEWKDIVSVSAGNTHIVGLKSDGTVVAVGENYSGQCNVFDWNDVIQISAGCNFTAGLQKNGNVLVSTGGTKRKFNVDEIKNVKFISVRNKNLACIDFNGHVTLYGEGYGDKYESAKIKQRISEWNQIEYVSVGLCHIVAINRNGLVFSAGSNVYKEGDIDYWRDISCISAGKNYTVGIKNNGTAISIGNNISGECDVQNWSEIEFISVGDNHTVGLKSDGEVVATGDNSHGECDVLAWNLL